MARIKINEQQYKAILSHLKALSSEVVNESQLIKESPKEVLLATTTIINNVMGKKMTNYNKVIADKAVSNPEIMKQVKASFEDELKLRGIVDSLSDMGIENAERVLSDNSYKIVDEYNKLTSGMGLNMSSSIAANLNDLGPKKKKN